ncbi:hypothetical protein AZI86_17650 [Bdellovibrio bacteriovorus]|uniref:DUF4423 domain-containing protein n=1 Tax=Bdellovibrio bacteriovorus TaxID=959 RepID=A0A150WEX7_BDEBC|nr:TIGR02147 family protein [Bdellovibrio bacteriovorus]KYG61532.1 hypothetical protein AZI86_17650 [Bdellovibrio bacteriovorus]
MDSNNTKTRRPDIADFDSASDFLFEMYMHLKKNGGFSLRKRCREVDSFSQAFVSQVLNRQRNITPKNLPFFAELFFLTPQEKERIAEHISSRPRGGGKSLHLLKNWFNPYVMALAEVRGFSADSPTIERMLGGLLNKNSIEKSIDFLFTEGFWKKSLNGQVTLDPSLRSHDQATSSFIVERFHQRALDIAKRGIDTHPSSQRKNLTVLLSVNQEEWTALSQEIELFERRLNELAARPTTDADQLLQVSIHSTPISVSTKKKGS